MSSSCISQYCSADCCNYYGTCPTYSGSSSYTSCYYYYDDYYSYYILSWWVWTLIGVGIFLFVISVIAIIVCCCRACSASAGQEVIIDNTNPSINSEYNYNAGYNANYNADFNYNQGYNQQGVAMNVQAGGMGTGQGVTMNVDAGYGGGNVEMRAYWSFICLFVFWYLLTFKNKILILWNWDLRTFSHQSN